MTHVRIVHGHRPGGSKQIVKGQGVEVVVVAGDREIDITSIVRAFRPQFDIGALALMSLDIAAFELVDGEVSRGPAEPIEVS